MSARKPPDSIRFPAFAEARIRKFLAHRTDLKCTKVYDEGVQELMCDIRSAWNSCRRTRSKPKQTAKIFSTRRQKRKSNVAVLYEKARQGRR